MTAVFGKASLDIVPKVSDLGTMASLAGWRSCVCVVTIRHSFLSQLNAGNLRCLKLA